MQHEPLDRCVLYRKNTDVVRCALEIVYMCFVSFVLRRITPSVLHRQKPQLVRRPPCCGVLLSAPSTSPTSFSFATNVTFPSSSRRLAHAGAVRRLPHRLSALSRVALRAGLT